MVSSSPLAMLLGRVGKGPLPMGTDNGGGGASDGERGWLYGMEMDSYKSRILDGVLVQKQKSYEPVSQIACVSVSIFWY